MRKYWAEVWRSSFRATVVGAVLSIIIASILYWFNWHTFYNTSANLAGTRAEMIANDIKNLALTTDAAPGNDDNFRKVLNLYLNGRRQLITISRIDTTVGSEPLWIETNGVQVDESRTLMDADFDLEVTADQDPRHSLHVNVKVGIRPPYLVSLARAWSFSILDYIDNPKRWMDEALYNRSIHLFGYLLTIVLVGFGTIRAICRDQQELDRLESQALEVSAELVQLRNQHSEEIVEFRKHIHHAEHQREDAVHHRKQLIAQIAGIEREYQDLIATSASVHPDDPRLQETANRKSQVERVLASYNVKVSYYEHELDEARSELSAAEQLLNEVEERRESLNTKLLDRNREIRKLRGLILDTQKEMRSAELAQLRLGKVHLRELREWEESQDTIEEQLGYWVKSGDHASVNFSEHSKVGIVEQQLKKIDPAFVDRYFTHVNNSRYERGARRLIRVVKDDSNDADLTSAKLIIALDDDAGRTISLRYEIHKDAPDLVHIGFVLALLLRTKCKDFRNFSIRTP